MDKISLKFVSVIMPTYNEENYIRKCIESLLEQDYPKECMEWIFVDGNSIDYTKNILLEYREKYPELIKVCDNKNKTVPYAMNIGIESARGEYIIRLDAHADYSRNYISKCVYYLDITDADNVGGVIETKSRGFTGEAIATMLSSKFGVGNSHFRTNGGSGYVDTVPFGAFRKEVFQKWGGYDVRLTRNQDNELNHRIRKNGGKIFLAEDIKLSYYCRDSIRGISDMAVKNGMWNVITMKLCPGSMGMRHFVPFAFFMSIVLLVLLSFFRIEFFYILGVELVFYFSLNIFFSVKTKKIKYIPLLVALFPIFHLSYGFGSLKGMVCLLKKDFRN